MTNTLRAARAIQPLRDITVAIIAFLALGAGSAVSPAGAQTIELQQAFDGLQQEVARSRASIAIDENEAPRAALSQSSVASPERGPAYYRVREADAGGRRRHSGASASIAAEERSLSQPQIYWNPDADLLTRIDGSLTALRFASGDIAPEDQAAYAQSIRHNAELVNFARTTGNLEERNLYLVTADSDLSVKLLARRFTDDGPRLTGRVSVQVRTWRNGREIDGFLIKLNPVRWTASTYFRSLDSITSPAHGTTTPGIYDVIVVNNGVEIARDRGRSIGIGQSGPIDVQVP